MASAADRIVARMVAEGDSPAAAYVRLVAEDGPAPVVGWDRAVYEPLRPPSIRERLWARVGAWWSYRGEPELEWPVRTEAHRAHLRAFLEEADRRDGFLRRRTRFYEG
jgi:hypothetical protein